MKIPLKFRFYMLVMVLLLGFSLTMNSILLKKNHVLYSQLPFLLVDEKIPYFELLDSNGKSVGANYLRDRKPLVIFVFEQPCSPCNRNISIWNHLARTMKTKVNFIGVVFGDVPSTIALAKSDRIVFPVFRPSDSIRFRKENRMRPNQAQTVVCFDGRVRLVKCGDLEMDDLERIMVLLRRIFS